MWAFAKTLAKLHMGFYIYIAHVLLNYVSTELFINYRVVLPNC